MIPKDVLGWWAVVFPGRDGDVPIPVQEAAKKLCRVPEPSGPQQTCRGIKVHPQPVFDLIDLDGDAVFPLDEVRIYMCYRSLGVANDNFIRDK